ncbi:steroid 21-hydroxylase-like [Gopherus flavomarginatus]|uniref:steroid 21-hydroxylase-like n=1 Tax=Gopherus flavomarginatus TaxID=286002 RepID=UPI0021CC43C0|nr:steroid 21-hydroxylase-like [Gopherus flavomarginatus]
MLLAALLLLLVLLAVAMLGDMVMLNSVESIRQVLTQKWSDLTGRPPSFRSSSPWGGHDLSLGNFTPSWQLQRKAAHSALVCAQRLQLDPVLGSQVAMLCQESLLPECPWDMVDHMLGERRGAGGDSADEGGLTPEHVYMALVDLFSGGTETMAALLIWAVAFLLHHPQVRDRIHTELQWVMGPKRPLSYGDRDRLPLLSATISEMMRLRPVVPLALPHSTTWDTSLSGFTIPEGTTVIPNLFAAHHHSERFLAQHNLLPFSCGARACLGETLARVEIFVFLGHVLHEFRLEPPAPGALPALRGVFGTMVRCPPFHIRFLPRGSPNPLGHP